MGNEPFTPRVVGKFCRYDCKGHPRDLLSRACTRFGTKKREYDECGRLVRCWMCMAKYGLVLSPEPKETTDEE